MSKDRVNHPKKLKGHTPVPDKSVNPQVTYWYCKCSTPEDPIFLGYSRRQALYRIKDHIQNVRDKENASQSEIQNDNQ